MARKVNVDDLVSTAEIAERLGLKDHKLVNSWRRRYADFPEPVARLAIGFVYAFSDLEAWAVQSDRSTYTRPPHQKRT